MSTTEPIPCEDCGHPDRDEAHVTNTVTWDTCEPKDRGDMDEALEYIRGLINAEPPAEGISYGQIAWLQDNAAWIDPDDTELLQWAGVEEEDRYRPGQGTGVYLDNPEQGV